MEIIRAGPEGVESWLSLRAVPDNCGPPAAVVPAGGPPRCLDDEAGELSSPAALSPGTGAVTRKNLLRLKDGTLPASGALKR